jgi:hypothetical protein
MATQTLIRNAVRRLVIMGVIGVVGSLGSTIIRPSEAEARGGCSPGADPWCIATYHSPCILSPCDTRTQICCLI